MINTDYSFRPILPFRSAPLPANLQPHWAKVLLHPNSGSISYYQKEAIAKFIAKDDPALMSVITHTIQPMFFTEHNVFVRKLLADELEITLVNPNGTVNHNHGLNSSEIKDIENIYQRKCGQVSI